MFITLLKKFAKFPKAAFFFTKQNFAGHVLRYRVSFVPRPEFVDDA